MNSPSVTSRSALRVPLDRLSQFHFILTRMLTEAGQTGPQLTQLFSADLRAECAECGIQIGGEEILQVALATDRLADPRLDRMRLGYCARKDCKSYHLFVRLDGEYPIDWNSLGAALETTQPSAASTVEEVESPSKRRFRFWPLPRTVIFVVLGLGLIVVILLFQRVESGQPLFSRSSKPKYQIDPASLRRPSH